MLNNQVNTSKTVYLAEAIYEGRLVHVAKVKLIIITCLDWFKQIANQSTRNYTEECNQTYKEYISQSQPATLPRWMTIMNCTRMINPNIMMI